MKTLKTTLSAAAVLLALPLFSSAGDKSIYGEDNRLDYYAAPAEMRVLADSVVSLWQSGDVKKLGAGKVRLLTYKLEYSLNFCSDTRFLAQPKGPFCSGALVGPDLVLTAGHCVTSEADCKDTKMAFGYAIKTEGGGAATTLPAGEVYNCAGIVRRVFTKTDADFALLRLNRPVTGHQPLSISRGADLKEGDGVFVIGHPLGLPLKVAGGATVRDYSPGGFFSADLDTFHGNSGSPVFNAGTGKIEGVLVRGAEDFADRESAAASKNTLRTCVTMATYAQAGGTGESVTKVSLAAADIPPLPGEEAGGGAAEKAVDADPGILRGVVEGLPAIPVRFD
ncbi:MAG: serine protease [Elusimicrobia bacterium]|nr:serine protease [Elusimicrobiota bacterium]